MGDVNLQRRQELHQAVHEARIAYQKAQARYDQALKICHDSGFKHPDGAFGMKLAASEYSKALERYSKAVSAFSKFLLDEPRQPRKQSN